MRRPWSTRAQVPRALVGSLEKRGRYEIGQVIGEEACIYVVSIGGHLMNIYGILNPTASIIGC
jgi:hypothetical protein